MQNWLSEGKTTEEMLEKADGRNKWGYGGTPRLLSTDRQKLTDSQLRWVETGTSSTTTTQAGREKGSVFFSKQMSFVKAPSWTKLRASRQDQ